MLIFIKPLDDGPLDINFKAGDIVQAKLDTDPVGNQEKKSWVAAMIPDPTNAQGNPFPQSFLTDTLIPDLARQEFAAGPTPDENVLRRERKHSVPNFRQKFSPEELVIIDDGAQTLPDGDTAFGGTVLNGIVSGLFTFEDIVRK